MGKITVPFVGMIFAEIAQVTVLILSKQVMSQGMTSFIFIFYSNSIAALILLPSSFFIHRFQRPPITFSTLSGFFLLGLLGYLAQVCGYVGIYYSSSTLATAMRNLVPGFTFILAVLFRFIS
ncbi:auxin-induced protein 5ng4-like [Trifolium pratense]|uniref:WAT1-related protein n=1 Tax=Trifolium pratense TaxID=57577 RepID=A0A2K3K7A7_TRIPR|nr:auxin-induced protein 5ng4-like [Trifolium pratense]